MGVMAGTAPSGATARLVRLGGLAALLGGAAWTVKGSVILVSGEQPPLLFEVGPVLFGVGLLGVACSTMRPGRRRSWVLAAASLSSVSGLAALASDLVGEEWGPALALSSLALLIGLLTLPRRGRWPAPLGWGIGLSLVPALVVGGALSQIDERLLEIPLTCLGIAWMAVGWAVLRGPDAQKGRVAAA
jgi:hypothetical protein